MGSDFHLTTLTKNSDWCVTELFLLLLGLDSYYTEDSITHFSLSLSHLCLDVRATSLAKSLQDRCSGLPYSTHSLVTVHKSARNMGVITDEQLSFADHVRCLSSLVLTIAIKVFSTKMTRLTPIHTSAQSPVTACITSKGLTLTCRVVNS